MNLSKREKLQRYIWRVETYLRDYKENGLYIDEKILPLWLKRFINECKKNRINDVIIVNGESEKRGYKEYLSGIKDKIRYKIYFLYKTRLQKAK